MLESIMESLEINVNSEIGELEAVLIHPPGQEVENMTPRNVERALYSDILNLSVATTEYYQFEEVLKKLTKVFRIQDLLSDIIKLPGVRSQIIENINRFENITDIAIITEALSDDELSKQLIEGVITEKKSLTKYLDDERYSLKPLHNFFFTRDSAVSINEKVFISRMANPIRMRESSIMDAIFEHHPAFKTQIINPQKSKLKEPKITYEGGDLIIVEKDILIIGLSQRTSSQGIDFIINNFKSKKNKRHIIVQELPASPESFIHLDMAFSMIDIDKCMVYKPLIIDSNHYATIHIVIDNGEVKTIREKQNIISVLNELGLEVKAVYCGGDNDIYIQEREQWHSGANFFSLGPGKIIGYSRNNYTIDELNKYGFEVINSVDVINEKIDINDFNKYVIVFEGSELSRGGGGARCMTMPLRRKPVGW